MAGTKAVRKVFYESEVRRRDHLLDGIEFEDEINAAYEIVRKWLLTFNVRDYNKKALLDAVCSMVLTIKAYERVSEIPSLNDTKKLARKLKNKAEILADALVSAHPEDRRRICFGYGLGKEGMQSILTLESELRAFAKACQRKIKTPLSVGAPRKRRNVDIARDAVRLFEVAFARPFKKSLELHQRREFVSADTDIVYKMILLFDPNLKPNEVQGALKTLPPTRAKLAPAEKA